MGATKSYLTVLEMHKHNPFIFFYTFAIVDPGWLGSRVVSVLDPDSNRSRDAVG